MVNNNKNTISNRKAFFDYEIIEKIEAGIVLKGTEVKSLRNGRANFKDSYARIDDNEVWIINFHISPYEFGNIYNHDPLRNRKLLLHKQEIKRLRRKVEEGGYTLVPIRLYFVKGNAKVEIALAKGKKSHDKRNDISKRDQNRDMQRELKNKFRVNI